MKESKRYFWLKLNQDFFRTKAVRALRHRPDGDAFCIMYQQMMLAALNDDGLLRFEGLEPSLEAELALCLDADEERIAACVAELVRLHLAELCPDGSLQLIGMDEMVGSCTQNAKRMRDVRSRNKADAQCATQSEQCASESAQCATEIEKESDIESEKEIYVEPESENLAGVADGAEKPSIMEVEEYCLKRGGKVNAERFYRYYDTRNWHIDGKAVRDWRSLVDYWEKHEKTPTSTGSEGMCGSSFDTDDFIEAALRRSYGGTECRT